MADAGRTQLLFRPGEGPCGDVLVLVLLRGGWDGLYAVPPHADPHYRVHRSVMAMPEPGRTGGIIDLEGEFGLHPALSALSEPFRARQLAVIHACGGPDTTLSHFDATRSLERGVDTADGAGTGWLARHLATSPTQRTSPIRAAAFSTTLPDVLAGVPDVALVRSLADIRIDRPSGWSGFESALGELYAKDNEPIAAVGRQSLSLLREMRQITAGGDGPRHGADYPADGFGRGLREVARLVRAEMGLEAAVLELGGWDSHIDQIRQLAGPLDSLGRGLAAFARDLGDHMRTVTVVAMSEFGRRVRENAGGGTDHGRASAMFVMGGGVAGGKVYSRWPGLAPDRLDASGNLPVTTDYRSVLAEIVSRRLKNPAVGSIFPRFSPTPVGVVPLDTTG